ncbi:MAG: DUF4252 domain-containing protein [Bacteroidota bacterium]
MKYVITGILSFALSVGLSAQNFVLDNYQDLVDGDNSVVVHVSQDMFGYIATFVDEEDEIEDVNAKEFLSNIKSLDLVATEEADNAKALYRRGKDRISDRFSELVTVKSKETNLGVYVDDDNGTVYEVIGIGTDDDDFFAVSILCEIRIEDIGKVISKMNSRDFSAFNEISEVDFDQMKVYPNPVENGSSISIEIPSDFVGSKAIITDMSGAAVKTFNVNSSEENINLDGLKPGQYFISVNSDMMSIKKKILVVD